MGRRSSLDLSQHQHTVAVRLRLIREAANYSAIALTDKLGIVYSTYKSVENANSQPKLSYMYVLFEGLCEHLLDRRFQDKKVVIWNYLTGFGNHSDISIIKSMLIINKRDYNEVAGTTITLQDAEDFIKYGRFMRGI